MSLEIELTQGNKYRDQYRQLLKYLLGLSVVAAGLATFLVVQLVSRGEPAYYATTTTGDVVQLNSLSEPIVTSNYILQWSSLATRAILNLHFSSYQDDLQQASGYFTKNGWSSFQDALDKSGMLQTITQNKLDASAIVSGEPVILDKEISHGSYVWRVQLPVLVTYTSASQNQQAQFIVTMDVSRVPVVTLETGIAITNFSARRIYVGSNQ